MSSSICLVLLFSVEKMFQVGSGRSGRLKIYVGMLMYVKFSLSNFTASPTFLWSVIGNISSLLVIFRVSRSLNWSIVGGSGVYVLSLGLLSFFSFFLISIQLSGIL